MKVYKIDVDTYLTIDDNLNSLDVLRKKKCYFRTLRQKPIHETLAETELDYTKGMSLDELRERYERWLLDE